MTTDPDIIVLTPNAPMTNVYENNDGWSGGSRCDAQGGVVTTVPIPTDFVVPGASSSEMPNNAAAFLLPDGHTLVQGQPFTRCTAGGTATIMWVRDNDPTSDLFGLGFYGAHGGSMLSSIGGTIRLGELVPGGVIHHALKLQLYGAENYYYDQATQGYRWPALTADGYASSTYGGTNPALRMGSLLALPASTNLDGLNLQTEPARILAKALQDYGGYVVDDTYWDVYAIGTEFSPAGRVEDEFQTTWSYAMDRGSLSLPWSQDMSKIFQALAVVDNWDATRWAEVAASDGTEGAGGGAPRVPWASSFSCSQAQVTVQSPAAGIHVHPGDSVTVTWSSSGSLQANSVALSFSADAGATWDPSFATNQPLNGTTTWQVPNVLTSQAVLRAVAKDTNGTDVIGRSGLFVIESAPVGQVSLDSPGAGAHFNGGTNVTVAWSSSGSLQANSVSLSFSSDGGTSWGSPFATGLPLSGWTTWTVPHLTTTQARLRAVAKDTNGVDAEGRSGLFTIESGTVVARITSSAEWPRPGVAVTFDASTSSASALSATLQARWDWENDGTWDTAFSSTLTASHAFAVEAIYTVHLEVRDSTGLTDNTTRTFAVDGTPPITTARVSGTAGLAGWFTSLVTVTLSAADNRSGPASTSYRIDGATWRTYAEPFTVDEGRHQVDFYSIDTAGVTEPDRSLALNVDQTSPTFDSASPAGNLPSSLVSIAWHATDDLSPDLTYATSLDGAAFVDRASTSSFTAVLPDGDHNVLVRATDEAGNSAVAAISFHVDTNLFSFTGPYSGIPTLVGIAAIVVLIAVAVFRWKKRT